MSSDFGPKDTVIDTNQHSGLPITLAQGLGSTGTASDETAYHETSTTFSFVEQDMPTQDDNEVPHSTPQIHQEPMSRTPFIFQGEDETIIFNDIDNDPWKYFISSPDDIDDEAFDAYSTHDNEDEDYWVEFEHEGKSPWYQNEQEDNATTLDANANSEPDDTDETEIDLPLCHFEPLPIGPFAPTDDTATHPDTSTTTTTETKSHPHPCPRLTPNPTTKTITITYNDEQNFNCIGFQLARYVTQMANVPLPLSRRIHELQGCIGEERRGSREWRVHKGQWLEGWGSPLWESWVVVGGDEEENDVEEDEGNENGDEQDGTDEV